jgi:hypothetical protein
VDAGEHSRPRGDQRQPQRGERAFGQRRVGGRLHPGQRAEQSGAARGHRGLVQQRVGNGGVQQGLILRWNGSSWSADSDPTAGTFSPLYGAATFGGSASEWAAGINGSDQALVLSHS